MEKLLKYSVLRYSPSTIAGEKINLGIIFCDEENGYREFRYSKKFSRLASFDDEIDIDMVKELLKGIQEDVEGTLFTYSDFDIDKYTKYYVNDFSFERPKAVAYDDLNEMVTRLHKTYFRFEYEKAERPSKEDDKKIVEELIRASGADLRKNEYLLGASNEKIKYDFVTDKYCVKIFDFDGKDLSKLISNAKSWAWNCMHSTERECIVIYRYSEDKKKYLNEFDIIMDIFNKAHAKVYDINSGLEILQSPGRAARQKQ